MSEIDTDLLTELLEQRRNCLASLHALGLEQARLIQQDDMDNLLATLDRKQRYLHALQQIEQALRPFREQPPERRHWRSPEHQQRCRLLQSEGETLLRQMMQGEEDCTRALQQRRETLQQQLRQFHSAHEVRSAYLGGASQVREASVLTRGGQLDLSET